MSFHWRQFKNERLILGAIFIGGILLITGSFYSKLSFPETNYNFLGTSGKAKLDPGKAITQVFTAQENNLNQIKIVVENFDLLPGEKILFELADPLCQTSIASDEASFLTPDPQIYYRFNFSPLTDSRDKQYCFRVTYFSPFDRGDKRPYLKITQNEQFQDQSYTNESNGRVYAGRTLQMRPAYGTGTVKGDLERLINRLSQYKPAFAKGSSLILLFTVFFLGTLALGFSVIFFKEDTESNSALIEKEKDGV